MTKDSTFPTNYTGCNGSVINFNATVNSSTSVSWAITGCTLSQTVDAGYCAERCAMCDHCEIGIARKKQWKKRKEKVHFT
jgi:hypothetical protein